MSRIDPDGKADIYIGGGGDSVKSGIVSSYRNRQPDIPGRTVRYFTVLQIQDAIAFANSMLGREPINIIGHSWGATAAVQVARGVKGRVDTLVGVDPVGGRLGSGGRPENVANVVAVNGNQSTWDFPADHIEFAGRILGGRPRTFTKKADITINVDMNHEDFGEMYEATGECGSAKDIVDSTYLYPELYASPGVTGGGNDAGRYGLSPEYEYFMGWHVEDR